MADDNAGTAVLELVAVGASARLAAGAGVATVTITADARGTTREPAGIPEIDWDDETTVTNTRIVG